MVLATGMTVSKQARKECCQFGFLEGKFVTFGFFQLQMKFGFFGHLYIFYVDLADSKMILADLWLLVDF